MRAPRPSGPGLAKDLRAAAPVAGAGRPTAGPGLGSTGLVATGIAVLQWLAVLNPAVVEADPEERFNAGHGLQLVQGHLDALWELQYRDFCGGCTLDALLGAALFTVAPPSWFVWKLVPIAFTALLAALGFRLLHRQAGRAAAVAFALLLAFPPRSWLHLSLVAWGNHYEAGVVAACVALLLGAREGRRQSFAAGVLCGLGLSIGFSGAFALGASLVWLGFARRWEDLRWFATGLPLGLCPWFAYFAATGHHPFVTIYESGEAAPSLARIPHKLSTLVFPRQLAAIFGLPARPWGWVLGVGWGASLLAALGLLVRVRHPAGRVAAVFLATWTATYLVVRFQVYDPPWPEVAGPGSTRYAAPLHPLAFIVLAVVAGELWRRRPAWAVALLAPPLAAGLAARVETFLPPWPAPVVLRMAVVDYDYFRLQASYVLDREAHLACPSGDPQARAWHAYAIGRADAGEAARAGEDLGGLVRPRGFPERHWLEGIGQALADDFLAQGAGGWRVVDLAVGRAEAIPGIGDADLAVVARAAAWKDEDAAWREAVRSHNEASWSLLAAETAGRGGPRADGLWWAAGRRWAWDVSALGVPARIELPVPRGGLPEAFVEGFGHGLGEEWGPQEEVPLPAGIGPEQESAFLAGYVEGVGRNWIGPARAPGLTP